MRDCSNNGIWAIYSALDPRALPFKPGLRLDHEQCDDIINRLDPAVGQARVALFGAACNQAWTMAANAEAA